MLEVKDIDVFHGAIQALWQVSLRVEDGELVSLIGANGSGKTTIVESIAGLLKPAAGTVHFKGLRVDQAPAHKVVELGISLIPEDKGIFRGMSVLENLELGAFSPQVRKNKEEVFRLVFDLFPVLQDRKEQTAGTLSGGEQQMLAIGRALMGKPKLLMCDEPSLGLAPLVVKNIFKVIEQVNHSGVGVILVEQNVPLGYGAVPMSEGEKRQLFARLGGLKKEFRYGQVCLRCGYCLPCPQGIDVPEVFRALDVYQSYPENLRRQGLVLYQSLDVKPGECAECRECRADCPAGLDIPGRLKEAAAV